MTLEKYSRFLTLRYIVALSVVAALSLASHAVLNRTLVAHAGAASVINVSGRQRMLSQRIASLAAQSALGDASARVDLTQAIDAFDRAHIRLIHGDLANGLPAPTSSRLQEIYFTGPHPLDGEVRSYIARARCIAALPPGDPQMTPELGLLFSAAKAPLLDGLNAVTAEHQRQSEQQLRTLKTIQTVSLIMILTTLAAEALGIFRPMVQRIMRYTGELNRAASIDPLTGALNRRSFTDRALAELARASRSGHATSLLMLDADRFKAVNDTYGHSVGDEVLSALSSTVQLSLRPSDLMGRMGGEEFAILLPETDLNGACLTADRLRIAIAALRLPVADGEVAFTVSLGVTDVPPGETGLKLALDRADAALYKSKSAGRNRVTSSPCLAPDADRLCVEAKFAI